MSRRFDFRPQEPTTAPTTISGLRAWMQDKGCNFLSYGFDGAPIAEGFVLKQVGPSFHWIYTERGIEHVDKVFATERDAVAFAFDRIRVDGWAWSHMVGFMTGREDVQTLGAALDDMRIPFCEDVIPYGGPEDLRYRVFVHGRHAAQVAELRKRFGG